MMRINIKELEIFANHGVLSEENILGQKYQTYEGFYMPKATFMGGIKIYIAPRQRATSFFH